MRKALTREEAIYVSSTSRGPNLQNTKIIEWTGDRQHTPHIHEWWRHDWERDAGLEGERLGAGQFEAKTGGRVYCLGLLSGIPVFKVLVSGIIHILPLSPKVYTLPPGVIQHSIARIHLLSVELAFAPPL